MIYFQEKLVKLKAFRKHFLGPIFCVQSLLSTATADFLDTAANAADDTNDNGSDTSDEHYPSPSFQFALASIAFLEKLAVCLFRTRGASIVNEVFEVFDSIVDSILNLACNFLYGIQKYFQFES